MTDSSIAKVYQFISTNYSSIENWKNEVDQIYGNGDGILKKSEFNTFMIEEYFKFEEDDNPNDIVKKFWASIDTKTTGKVAGTGISSVNALDKEDLEKAELLLQVSNKISDFLSKKPEITNYESLKISNPDRWINSIKEGMLNKLSSQVKESDLEDQSRLQTLMERAYQQTVRKATADYVKNDIIDKEIRNNAAFSGITYEIDKDRQLTLIVENYIKSLDGDEKTPLSDIVANVEKLVKAYADTAKTNSQTSIDTLGSSYYANGKLNNLQMAVLVHDVTEGINKKLEKEYEALYKAYGDMITAKIKPFVENELKGKQASEFSSIKNDITSYVDKFFTSEIKDIQKEYDELQTAKKELKSYLSGKYTDKYKAAIKEVFGKDTQTEVEAVIDGYKTLADVQAAKSAIEAKLDDIDSMLDDSCFSGLTDTKVGFGDTKVIKLQNLTSKYSTNQLTYSVTNGGGNISVTNGTVTIKGTQSGTFRDVTVSVYADGKCIGTSSPFTIIVLEEAKGEDLSGTRITQPIATSGTTDKYIKMQTVDLAEAYQNNYVIQLSWFTNDDTAVSNSKSQMEKLLKAIKSGFEAKGYDTAALNTAYTKTKGLYDSLLTAHTRTNQQTSRTMSYTYEGETYTYFSKNYRYESSAGREFSAAQSNGGVINDTGIQYNYSYNKDDTHEFYVNIRNVVDIFMEFYKKALA